jgi:ribonuclease HI
MRGKQQQSNGAILACICVLKWIRENRPWDGVTRVQVFTDSQYVKGNLIRATNWKKNDWRNQYGEPRENPDLWKQLLSAHQKTGITVHFEWALGKKSPVLKRVDRAAEAAATRGGVEMRCVPADLWTIHAVFRVAKRNTEPGEGWADADGCWRETVAWLNQFRRLRVRYEKRADTDEAFLAVACAVICGKVFQKRPW